MCDVWLGPPILANAVKKRIWEDAKGIYDSERSCYFWVMYCAGAQIQNIHLFSDSSASHHGCAMDACISCFRLSQEVI